MFWSTRKTADVPFRVENVYVHPSSEIASDVELGQFSYVGPNCRIGEGTRIHNNATIVSNTIVGEHNEIYSGAVIGAEPQDKKFIGEESWAIIGDYNKIRECVTIHRGTQHGGGITRIGNHNLLMATAHVAHDCIVGDHVILANNVLLGGHARIDDYANLGGSAAIHHFVSVGQYAFVGGLARVTQDVPPFMLVEGNPSRVRSINRVGLKRGGFSEEEISILKESHRALFRTSVPRCDSLKQLLEVYPDTPAVKQLAEFLTNTDQGQQGRARQPAHR